MLSVGDIGENLGQEEDLMDDEALFKDCEKMYEIKSSVADGAGLSPPEKYHPASMTSLHDYHSTTSRQLLSMYYGQFFPLRRMLRWLAYGNEKRYLANREFSFTLENDVYLRYLSFDSPEALLARLLKDAPVKIDIGAVYSSRPTERKTLTGAGFRPVEHELVFDLDMTDYDDVRSCCRDKNICKKCWKFLAIAVEILDEALREDFGFRSLLWVFSGRRGVHCWVADSRARQMSGACRKSLLSYLELSKSYAGDLRKRGASEAAHHNHVERALNIIEENWTTIALNDQEVLSTDSARKMFLSKIGDDHLRGQVSKLWCDPSVAGIASPNDYWKLFCDLTINVREAQSTTNYHKIPGEMQIKYLYPRFDTNVSLQMNHLLKSPFCAHPSTGKICVPFRATEVWIFDPHNVPKLSQISKEGFSLDPYLQVFDEFLSTLEEGRLGNISKIRDDSQKSLAF